MKKKILIAAGVVIAVLLILLLILTLIGGGRKIDTGDEGGKYGYSLKYEGKSVLVSIDGSAGDGARWVPELSHEGVVEVKEKKQTEKGASFLVSPLADGICNVTFVLEKEGTTPERLYEIVTTFTLDPDGTFDYTGSRHTEIKARTRQNENGNYPYSMQEQKDGSLTVLIDGIGKENWEPALSADGIVQVFEYEAENQKRLEIVPIAPGTAVLTVKPEEGESVLTFTLSVNDLLTLTVTGHEIRE